ncbi:MAG TPA: hypothetical protein VH302_08915 [Bryobacteraceae bacterium]|nr:hypothetical protein [Bryobacteraceae bacterium]
MNRSFIATVLVTVVYLTGLQQPLYSQRLLPSIYDWQEINPAPDLSALKIVVIAGEDGVNIVKKKTAVQPVVEVRDKNNTPVSGVIVNFTTPDQGPSAVFSNGGHTFSAVTDTSGRVTVTGMQPTSTGKFQITVTASMQARVIATAIIGQTNFATASAAAAAGGTAASTGAAAGGLSTGLIVAIVAGVAAAAAAGAVLATHGGGTTTPTATIGVASGTATVGAPH